MSRLRRNLLLPVLAVSAALLLAAPASALPAFSSAESGWSRLLEPLFRLGHFLAPTGWAIDSESHPTPEPWGPAAGTSGLSAPDGSPANPSGPPAPPPSDSGWGTDPNG
jgi:hypothetical protein